ncbi:hypothetical protein MTO96_041435 [Rhipicephalus appendiculatus]
MDQNQRVQRCWDQPVGPPAPHDVTSVWELTPLWWPDVTLCQRWQSAELAGRGPPTMKAFDPALPAGAHMVFFFVLTRTSFRPGIEESACAMARREVRGKAASLCAGRNSTVQAVGGGAGAKVAGVPEVAAGAAAEIAPDSRLGVAKHSYREVPSSSLPGLLGRKRLRVVVVSISSEFEPGGKGTFFGSREDAHCNPGTAAWSPVSSTSEVFVAVVES